jgi:hypothetical protein
MFISYKNKGYLAIVQTMKRLKCKVTIASECITFSRRRLAATSLT